MSHLRLQTNDGRFLAPSAQTSERVLISLSLQGCAKAVPIVDGPALVLRKVGKCLHIFLVTHIALDSPHLHHSLSRRETPSKSAPIRLGRIPGMAKCYSTEVIFYTNKHRTKPLHWGAWLEEPSQHPQSWARCRRSQPAWAMHIAPHREIFYRTQAYTSAQIHWLPSMVCIYYIHRRNSMTTCRPKVGPVTLKLLGPAPEARRRRHVGNMSTFKPLARNSSA
jgi:hypothetical protein